MAILIPCRRRRGLRWPAVLLVLAATPACQPAPTEVRLTHTRVAVHAVLVAGDEAASVLLSRASASGGGSGPAAWDPVTDAVVRIIQGSDTSRLAAAAPCVHADTGSPGATAAGCYAGAIRGGIVAGGVYDLRVDVPGEAPIRGRTLVPQPPTILAPAAAQPVLFFSRGYHPGNPPTALTVRWTAPEPVARAELRLAPERDDCRATLTVPDRLFGSFWIDAAGADSAAIAPWSVDCSREPAAAYPARVVVTVYDERYARYLELHGRGQSIMLPQAGEGLTGAIGVFGAAASGTAGVVLVQR